MDTGILHSHHFLGVLLLVLVGVPVVFPDWARRLRRWHMVLDTLLLGTGIYLLFRAPAAFSPTALLKYVLVGVAIGLAIFGGRLGRKSWSVLAFLLLAYAYGLAVQRDFLLRGEESRVRALGISTPSLEAGQKVYNLLCQRCHGEDGRARYQKSASLQPASGNADYWRAVIRQGKGLMPAHAYLSPAELESLVLLLEDWQKVPAP